MQIQYYLPEERAQAVVICFKFSNFAYANTVLLPTKKNEWRVVICFKFSNFAYANTVYHQQAYYSSALLFALNLVTLLMQIQYSKSIFINLYGCYLL